ncbi:amidohydrolase, partial [Gammaproteobacteria bacterium]|nr:amidohydrolase [Gammaproteobacteria bacterium]
MKNISLLSVPLLLILGCSDLDLPSEATGETRHDAFASTYEPMQSQPTLFKSANIYDGLGGEFLDYDLLVADGKIIEMGRSLSQSGVKVIDASNKWITPGIIDIHSHMGVYSAPGVTSSS